MRPCLLPLTPAPGAPSGAPSWQEKFRHYSDLWRLSLSDWRWEQLPSKGGPSARSGHRMALYKNSLLLFGGFFDNGKETK